MVQDIYYLGIFYVKPLEVKDMVEKLKETSACMTHMFDFFEDDEWLHYMISKLEDNYDEYKKQHNGVECIKLEIGSGESSNYMNEIGSFDELVYDYEIQKEVKSCLEKAGFTIIDDEIHEETYCQDEEDLDDRW